MLILTKKLFKYLKGKPYSPSGDEWDDSVEAWLSLVSDEGCDYDDVVKFDASEISPTVTWGINPGQAIFIDELIPDPTELSGVEASSTTEALQYMKLEAGAPIKGTPINVAFIGSCTNGRISDLEEVASKLNGHRVKDGIKAIVVPGSQIVSKIAQQKGLDKIFTDAGFEWRNAGCSMCLAMNPDKLVGDELCASSSNRNFKGRQGSPTGRTMLMSPLMVAAAAISGEIADSREIFS